MPRTPLLRPGAYFEGRRSPPLRTAALAVGSLVLASFAATFVSLVVLAAGRTGLGGVVVAALAQLPLLLFGVLAFWLLVTLFVHLFVRWGDGDGGFRASLALVGWTLVPLSVPLVVGPLAPLVLYRAVPATPETAQPTFAAVGVVGLFAVLLGAGWQAYVCFGGMRRVHRTETPVAAGVAALAAVATLVLFLG
ncbi:Yip1 family protein [Haloprofundus salinisoli]|uniref:Yip1 family protein n=1 Tax=Haloprofundus salinisoli TaxID=2876193 RepID=UPI001CCCAE15|nr:Yip1 family protein [Haloprofundus salinisoli]